MDFPLRFISASADYADFDHVVPSPYLRKKFTVEKLPQSAELMITGLGFYRVFINGTEITKSILAPYISNPDDIIYYDQYEVSRYLREGENVIGIQLGNGLQNCFGGYIWKFDQARWRSAPMTALRLELTQQDGTKSSIESDTTFVTHDSPLFFDDMRFGEYYDARLELDGWSAPGYDDSEWAPAQTVTSPRGELRLCTASPIVIGEERTAVSIVPYEDGYLYDFGANGAGVCRLKVTGTSGQEIYTFHGEWYHDGKLERSNISFGRGNPREENIQVNRYICRGEREEIYTPYFAFYGFQYVYVKGITAEQATPDLLTYLVMHGDFQENGSFRCSDEVANKLQECTRRSTLSNFLWYPTDCPHREKNGWTGDVAVSAEHMLMNLTVDDSLREWLRGVAAAQNSDGALPGIVPTSGWGFAWGNGPGWDQVLTEVPFCLYRLRGELETAREHGASIFRYLQYIARRRDKRGLIAIGLGDWCPPGTSHGDYRVPLDVTDTAICIDLLRKASILFERLGWELELHFAQELRASFKTAFRKYLIDFSTMTVSGACQTSQAVAIYFDIFEPAEKAAAFARLKEMIAECDNHFSTGIIGNRVLFRVLADFDEADLAYEMITRPDFPSYGDWIAHGTTTLWEDFHTEDGVVYSLNHHFFGDISAWFMQAVAGIVPNPYFDDANRARIAPHFISALSFAEAKYNAPAGEIHVRWERNESGVLLDVSVPDGVTGSIHMPKGWRMDDSKCDIPLASGKYQCIHAAVQPGITLELQRRKKTN